MLDAAVSLNLAATNQDMSGSTAIKDFLNVNAAGLAGAFTILGSAGANTITGGSGAETIDGGGGSDVINGGSGNDLIYDHGTESSLNGGTGASTLYLDAATNVNLANTSDQVSSGPNVTHFTNVDASGLSSAISITGSAGGNTIWGGSGSDTIDGHGGADVIHAGSGNDLVYYYGSETSIDGGTGHSTLYLDAATNVNLANTGDQVSSGPTVTDFTNVDASGVSSAISIMGSANAATITGGSGAETIDGGGGADVIYGGSGNDVIHYHGTETSINAGTGDSTLHLDVNANVDLANTSNQISGGGSISNFENVDASATTGNITLQGATGAGVSVVTAGSGDDTLIGTGGDDVLHGGSGNDLFILDTSAISYGAKAEGSATSTNTVEINGSGTVTDAQLLSSLTNIQNIDFSQGSATANLSVTSAEVTSISGSVNNTLTLTLNADDHVNVVGYSSSTVIGSTTAYTLYNDSQHDIVIGHLHVVT